MSLAIIDAREWQNRFDLETGRKSGHDSGAAQMLSQVLSRHPYPGDMDERANQWVSETALDLMEQYEPDLVCLSYVQQFFANRHFRHSKDEQAHMFSTAMAEAERFIEISGYTPVYVSNGGMVAQQGDIDLSGLDGLALSSNWSARYCGLHRPSAKDLDYIRSIRINGGKISGGKANGTDPIERIVSKSEWIDLFKAAQPDLDMCEDQRLLPDYLVIAKQGFSFKALGTTLRKPVNIPAHNFEVPVYTPLGAVGDIRDIRPLILENIKDTKIALILLEGLELSSFPSGAFLCSNSVDWFCHESGDSFYLTLSTGKHQPFVYPTGFRYFDRDEENIQFPFSGYLTSIPENTLAMDIPQKSIAVGNRSMFTHMMFGADIAIECFARNLFNQGLMGVVHREKGLGVRS